MNPSHTDEILLTGEEARIAALESYGILDTPEEQVFDEFARLAASICGTPIALISFVDGHRQWFKARTGLKETQTPRSIAFCSHAIGSSDVFVIPDAREDERFALNPLVTGDPKIRFYAGAPLVTLEGQALGTLCVIDVVPHKFTPEQKDALQILSRHVMAQLELRRRLAQFTRGNAARQKTLADIRRAITDGEFILHYQPTVDVVTGRVAGLEALIRWNCPERGLIAPADFVPLLEDSRLIIEVGNWVLRQAVADYRGWKALGLHAPRIAVNVSSVQLQHPDFLGKLKQALDGDGTSSTPLDIDIAEGMLVENTEAIIGKLIQVRQLGVRIALDDFGSGHSALRYLTRLPLDSLKIDGSFVANMTENPDDMSVVSNIIALAHSLRLTVVAEGVETEEQQKLLRLLRCDQLQGFVCTHPVPKEEIETILLENQRGAEAGCRSTSGKHPRTAPAAEPGGQNGNIDRSNA
jgi:EAL domain-containing protein (putative c-di-GMP-specific phosphodiesterase class I)